ncbi:MULTISPECIES: CvpA family protein [Cellulophaga]|uniref:CvpA family protein n=1 Tax=Cellulophaga TaxID=104264 RepID=UPI0004F757E4|nr:MULTISPECIES: CvpA family protein [Cellulophaga]AIM59997.1 colicin V production protein [Cellulophaga lytica]APU09868.1 colicin V production protein [Cellulophaga lytica]TVZ08483.1 membrane protein required for colicin V production [Cellulophaga sp. RHA_52]SNQ42293.1 CvpA family protein [Cellulophaga lytica]
MNFLDIILGILLIWGLYKGIKNGLLIEVASLVALVAGIYAAIHFSYIIGNYLTEKWQWDQSTIHIASSILTFIVVVLIINLVGKLLTKVAKAVMLGTLNRIAGGLFGALKVAVIIGALLLFLDQANNKLQIVKQETIKSSALYTPIKTIGELVFAFVMEETQTQEHPTETL